MRIEGKTALITGGGSGLGAASARMIAAAGGRSVIADLKPGDAGGEFAATDVTRPDQMQAAVDFRFDIVNGLIKSFVFGIAVSLIAVFEGYEAPPTAEGVSVATTRTVVGSSLAILGLDFVLTVFMFRGVGV